MVGKKLKQIDSGLPEYHIIVLGAGCVGKSCMIDRLINNSYSSDYIPTVSELYNVMYKRNLRTASNLIIYDTAGSIDFPAMRRLTISKSQACIVMFSVDSLRSFELAKIQLEEILQVVGKNFPCVLVANKNELADEQREVSFEKGLRCAVQYGCSYVEISAQDNVNICQPFDSALNKIEALEVMKRRASHGLLKQKRNSMWRLSSTISKRLSV